MPGPMKITTIKEGGIKRECMGVVATLLSKYVAPVDFATAGKVCFGLARQ